MKVALVHEFLVQLGGAERVLKSLHELFSEAPVYTLVYDPGKTQNIFSNWNIRTSFLQKVPGGVANYKMLLPLMPKAVESFNFDGYDLVISDSSAFAKGILNRRPTIHICYCHTPTRYLWQEMDEYVAYLHYSPAVKWLAKQYLRRLKKWDYRAAQRPNFFIANSETVRARIKRHYHRDSEVIYPPVDAEFFRPLSQPLPITWGEVNKNYYLTASRLEPYKKIDLVVEAFNRLNLPLKVAGTGTQFPALKSKAVNSKIQFLGRVSDEELRELYGGAKAFVFPALEDAGIMVLESLACGTPVIGLGVGGTREFVRDEVEGALFEDQTAGGIVEAVRRFEHIVFEPAKLRSRALEFDKSVFQRKIQDFIAKCKLA